MTRNKNMNLRKGSAQAVIALILAAMFLTIVTAGGLMNSNQSIPLSESTLVPATPTASSSVTLQGSNDFLIGFNTTNNEFYAQALNSTICFTSSICESVINFATNASPEGGLVQILAGSYPLTYSGIIVPRWVNLEGQGSTNTLIYALSTFNSSQGLITLQAAPSAGINYARYYQTISNLNLNGENVAAYDIYAPHTTSGFGDNYFVIQNDVFQSTRIACIWLGEDVGAGEIASNFFNSGGLFNICMWYTGDMSIHDNDMAGANIGIYAIGSGNSVFEDNKVYMAIYNPSVSMSGWGVVLNATYGMRMIGDRYDQNTVGGIYLYNTNSSTIDSCHTWLNAQNGYCVTGGYDDVITGCTSLEDNGTMGSIFEFISTNDIQVTGCSVQNPGVAGVSPDNLRAFDFYYCVSPTATALTAPGHKGNSLNGLGLLVWRLYKRNVF